MIRIEEACALTHRGMKKSENEDGVLQIPAAPLYAIVDGRHGTEAQEFALDLMRKHTRTLHQQIKNVSKDGSSSNRLAIGSFFKDVFAEIHERLIDLSDELEVPSLASSMIAVTMVEECAYITHIGNVRAYLLRGQDLWALTNDHTVAMAQLSQGMITPEEYEHSPHQMVLTQALGLPGQFDVEFSEAWLIPGDTLILCSDGLNRVVSDQTICETLHAHDLREATKALLRLSLAGGAPDNVSLISIRVEQDEADPATETGTNIMETLRSTFLFQAMSEADRSMVTPYLEDIWVNPGEVIVQEGEAGDHFYVIVEGQVRVSLEDTHLIDIGPGGQFGELGLVGDSRRTATVTALTKTRLFALSRKRFHEILQAKPKLSASLLLPLLARVKDRLRDVTERLAQLEKKNQD